MSEESATEHWFRPKDLGYGVVPIHWKGWALLIALGAGVLAATWAFIDLGRDLSGPNLLAWAVVVGAMLIAFKRTAQARTNGEWRYRKGSVIQAMMVGAKNAKDGAGKDEAR